jgi:hypothetical protein
MQDEKCSLLLKSAYFISRLNNAMCHMDMNRDTVCTDRFLKLYKAAEG